MDEAPAELTNALLAGDAAAAAAVLMAELAAGKSLAEVCAGRLAPAMAEVGRLWEAGRISVPQEHLATATAESVLARLFADAPHTPHTGRTAVLACAGGNHHRLGSRTVADAFALAGWRVVLLGADAPPNEVLAAAERERADVVGLSVMLPEQVPAAAETARRLRERFGPGRPRVIIGGKAVNESAALRDAVPGAEWHPDPVVALASLTHERRLAE